MRIPASIITALALALPAGPSWADASENCAVKVFNQQLGLLVTLIKAGQKICKGLDDGAEAAFDDLPNGNDDGTVDGEEMDIADFDFAKLTDKVNKIFDKLNTTLEKGGPECQAHSGSTPTDPPPTTTQDVVESTVAGVLNDQCH